MAAVATAGTLAALTGSAAAAGSGSVQATVTDGQGHPVAGACLYAGAKRSQFTSPPSSSAGSLTASDVPDGHYQGVLTNCTEAFPTNDGGVPVTFTVGNGRTTDLGTVVLPAAGYVYGTLDDGRTTLAAAGVSVSAWDPTTEVLVSAPTCTDVSGIYELKGLPTSGVKIEFGGGTCPDDGAFAPQWYGGSGWSGAAVVPIQAPYFTPLPSTVLATTGSSANGKVTVTGVDVSGAPGDPVVTVTGTGFGRTPPSGAAPGCAEPPSGAGVDYARGALYLSVPGFPPSEGGPPSWQAGNVGDCLGVVVSSWRPTQVVFSVGSWYGWAQGGVAQGVALFDGDPFMVAVKGARFTSIAAQPGSVPADLVQAETAAHALFVQHGGFPTGANAVATFDGALPGFSFSSGFVSDTGATPSVSVLVSPDQQIVIFAEMSTDDRCWYGEDNEEDTFTAGGVYFATAYDGVSDAGTPAGLVVPASQGCAANGSDPYLSTGPFTTSVFSGWDYHFPA